MRNRLVNKGLSEILGEDVSSLPLETVFSMLNKKGLDVTIRPSYIAEARLDGGKERTTGKVTWHFPPTTSGFRR